MIKAIITDIEGTITRISFVKDVLFPYAAKHLPEFVEKYQHTPEVATQLNAVKQLIANPMASAPEIIDALLNWIKNDEKVTPLKQLQGLIWQAGYENGDFTGHIYPDAFEFLSTQHREGTPLYVYSSGSVKAQQLLFEYSDYGDMRPLFQAYFDTKVGGKKAPQSYHSIVEQLPYSAAEVLFLSDIIEELDAAKTAGLATLQLWRDGQAQSPAHNAITDFNQYMSRNV